jgi:hypothetical protein
MEPSIVSVGWLMFGFWLLVAVFRLLVVGWRFSVGGLSGQHVTHAYQVGQVFHVGHVFPVSKVERSQVAGHSTRQRATPKRDSATTHERIIHERTILYLPFSILYSPFFIPCSPFDIRNSQSSFATAPRTTPSCAA